MYYSVSFRLDYTDTQAEEQTHKTHTWRAQKKPASCSEEVSWTFKKVGRKSPISLQPRAKSNTFYSAHTSWEKFSTVRVFMCTTYDQLGLDFELLLWIFRLIHKGEHQSQPIADTFWAWQTVFIYYTSHVGRQLSCIYLSGKSVVSSERKRDSVGWHEAGERRRKLMEVELPLGY